tara:strand:+ start:637 stop:882 length:246 start_codon:yes stop_codon:yes gene_type:complete
MISMIVLVGQLFDDKGISRICIGFADVRNDFKSTLEDEKATYMHFNCKNLPTRHLKIENTEHESDTESRGVVRQQRRSVPG